MRQQLKGPLLLSAAVVACPCHLPLLLVVLAGTSLGGFLSENTGLVMLGLGGTFVLALALSLRYLNSVERTISGAAGDERNAAHDCLEGRELEVLGRPEAREAGR